MTGLQGFTGSGHQVEHAYEVSGRGCRTSRVWNNGSNMHRRYQDWAAGHVRSGLQDLKGWELEIVHTYEVLGRGCRVSRVRQTRSGWGFRISRIRNNSSNMHTRNYNGAALSHG